jgi:hypothetical protein
MNRISPKFLFQTLILVGLSIFIAGCQSTSNVPPERPLYPNGRSTEPETTVDPYLNEVVPVLSMNVAGQGKEFKLRSQTARYLNPEKSALEIVLTDNREVSCQNPTPAFTSEQQKLIFTVKSKDGKAIAMGDLTADANFEKQAEYQMGEVKNNFDNNSVKKLEFTNINDAIARGNLKLESTDLSLEGEFFTAICN